MFVIHCDLNFRYGRAAEMYTKVLQLRPRDWRAQLNRGVSLLGAGDYEESKKAFKEAFKMTNRLDIHDAIKHLKQNQKKNPKGLTSVMASAEQSATGRHSSINGSYMEKLLIPTSMTILDLLRAHCLPIVTQHVVKCQIYPALTCCFHLSFLQRIVVLRVLRRAATSHGFSIEGH